MLVLWSAIAGAAVPSGLMARGSDIQELEVRQFAVSPSGEVVVACTESRVVPMTGGASEVKLDPGGLVAADVGDDGRLVLGHQGGVTIHESSGREILRLGGYTGKLADLALSPDGSSFAVASDDRVAVHSTADGRELWAWKGGAAWSVKFHPDGRKLIAGIAKGNLVLDARRGRVIDGFDTVPAVWLRFTDQGLYTFAEGGPVKTWDPVTLEATEPQLEIELQQAAAAHPSGSWLLVDGCVTAARTTHPSELCVSPAVTATAFGRDGSLFVAAGGEVRRWTPLDENQVTDLGLAPGGPRVVAITAAEAGDWVVATADGVLRRLAADGTARFEGRLPDCQPGRCAVRAMGSHEGETWAIGPKGGIQQWDASGQPVSRRPKRSRVLDAGRLQDGTWVSLMEDGRVRVSDRPGKGRAAGPVEGAKALRVGASGFVVIGEEVHPFKANGLARPVASLGPDRQPRAVATDSTGLAFAVLDQEGTVHRFSADGRPVFRESLELDDDVDELVWSADGAWLVVGGSPLRVFDAADGSPYVDVLLAPPGSASGLASSPFGFLGVVQGSAEQEEVRLVRLRPSE